MELQGKKVLVLGLARSGVASIHVLLKHGAVVIANDSAKPDKVAKDVEALAGLPVEIILEQHPLELLDQGLDLIVKNPGIPYDIPFLQAARAKGIPVVSEVELAWQVTKAPLVCITGSNGKTTTTAWVGEILRHDRANVHVAGNIGLPLSEEVDGLDEKHIVVVELSSFQLNDVLDFRPKVATLLNIYNTHRDWHHTAENYLEAKSHLFLNQTAEDWAILNAENAEVMSLLPKIKAHPLTFSHLQPQEEGAWLQNDLLMFRSKGVTEAILPLKELGIGYAHNYQNAMAAALTAYAAGASPEAIRKGLRSFQGVAHRFQIVARLNGVLYINDSKATNVQAALVALSLPGEPIILIAGGLDRGQDFTEFAQSIRQHCKAVILLGQTKERIRQALAAENFSNVTMVHDMEEAVEQSRRLSEPGDCVLLSPACASWDMYPDFEVRGQSFMDAVVRK
ncbi:MAG: UDP-N-acetylmuramoyl-L-alanine--D-glutamate ligase [Negativicutes bacterium]|nr:UDP-N-acetylmuramoyl-L-alanine--D-glutamate ligase [Negativicutes bacterium]